MRHRQKGAAAKSAHACLLKIRQQLHQAIKTVATTLILWWTAKNLAFSTMCLHGVVNLDINSITHTYFERRHSQNECDSVNARIMIESSSKNKNIYVPAEWMYEVQHAKLNAQKYVVNELDGQVLDIKTMSEEVINNRRKIDNGDTIKWQEIRQFQYKKTDPFTSSIAWISKVLTVFQLMAAKVRSLFVLLRIIN